MHHPYPLEYREGQLLMSTDLMLQGQNPFAVSQQPANTNTYGLVYHWLTVPFAKIWGPTYQVHRIVTAFCIFACLALLGWHWRRQGLPWELIAGAEVVFYASLLYPMTTTALAGGNCLGLLLMLASVLVPYHDRYSSRSLWLSAVFALLAFYTKSYFFLAAIFLAAYMFLFVDKKKALLFGTGLLGALLLSMLVIDRWFETYFSTTFFLNLSITGNEVPYLFKQLKTWGYFHRDLLAALALALAAAGINAWKNKSLKFLPMDLSLFCLLGYTALICAKLGRHPGSWMAYLTQLMSPWLLLYVLNKISRWRWVAVVWMVLMAAVFYKVDYKFIWSPEYAKQWEVVQNLVKNHQNALNSPVLVSFLLQEKKPIYDGGYTQWSNSGVERPGIWKFLKPDEALSRRNREFYEQLLEGVSAKKFDLIILTPGLTTFNFGEIRDNYKPVGLIKTFIPHFNEDLDLAVFVPAS